MIEQIIYDYLKDEYQHGNIPAPVYLMRPEKIPNNGVYYLIEKTGSSETNHITSATIAIQSYAPTLADAAALNEVIKSAMNEIVDLDEISKSICTTDYNFTNIADKQPRYQALFNVVYY